MYRFRLLSLISAAIFFAGVSNAQNRTITGVVTSNGNPLADINITVKDTKLSSVSDAFGRDGSC